MESDQKEFIEAYRLLCEKYCMYLYFNHNIENMCIAETSLSDVKEEVDHSIKEIIVH